MKYFIFIYFILSNLVFADSISGTISVKGSVPKGVLYVFAKKFDGKMRMPLAVKKVENPKFPYKFILNANDSMIKSIPFKGPFKVTARISPSGSVMDKSGIEATTNKPIILGSSDILLELVAK